MALDREEHLLEIDEELLENLRALIEAGNHGALLAILINIHAADIAQLAAAMPEEERHTLLSLLDQETVGEVMLHLPEEQREEYLALLEPKEISRIVEELSTDDAADVVSELPDHVAEEVLQNLQLSDQEATEEIRDLLRYDHDTAGGRMTTDYVAVAAGETVAASIETIREFVMETALEVYSLYVTDDQGRLMGIVRLQDLVLHTSATIVGSFMLTDIVTVRANEDQARVAQVMQRYDLIAVPVVDEGGALLGVVTFDDIADIIEDETSEDMLYLAGVTDEDSLATSPFVSIRRRLPWLVMNLGAGFITSMVVSQFTATTARVTELVALMPLVGSMGGNAAIQSITVIVRSIALGEIGSGGKMRAFAKETTLGLINGLAMGLVTGTLVWFMWDSIKLGLLIAAAMQINLLMAGIAGSVIPLTLRRLNFDPALSSGPLVTQVTDVSGYLTFLGLATLTLSWLLA